MQAAARQLALVAVVYRRWRGRAGLGGSSRLRRLRDRLYEGLVRELDGVTLNGPSFDLTIPSSANLRLPGNLNLSFAGVDGEALMTSLKEIAVSSGAACSSANPEPSHVLLALGLSEEQAKASLRFGLGRSTSADDIDRAVAHLADVVTHLRATAPLPAATAGARG